MKNIIRYILIVFCCTSFILSAQAAKTPKKVIVTMHWVTSGKDGKSAGTVTLKQTKRGVLFVPRLYGLPPGDHGFHVHQNPSCANHGLAAGGHFDPHATEKHLGPHVHGGHLGDLPVLVVNKKGRAIKPVLAANFSLKQLLSDKGHSLMIHEGGDNYSDKPKKLGGGGARIVCGKITT